MLAWLLFLFTNPAFGAPADPWLQLKSQSMEKSPIIRQARAQAGFSKAGVWTGWAKWTPKVDLQLSQTRSKDYSYLYSGTLGSFFTSQLNIQETERMGYQVGASLPIYRRAVHLNLDQAYAEKDVALKQLDSRETELDWILSSYTGAYLFQLFRQDALKRSVEIAKTNLKEARLRFELGQRTRVDVLRAEANLSSLESSVVENQSSISKALNDLIEYSGVSLEDLKKLDLEKSLSIDRLTSVDRLLKILDPYIQLPLEKIGERLAKYNAAYQGYIAQEDLSNVKAAALMAEEWPSLDARATYYKQGPNWSDATASGNESYSYGLVLTIPLVSGGSTISTYMQKSKAEDRSEIQRQQDLQKLKNEVQNEIIQIKALVQQLESMRLNVSQNEELERLSFKSYQLGKSTLVELQSAQTEALNSKVSLAKTKVDLATQLRKFAWHVGVKINE